MKKLILPITFAVLLTQCSVHKKISNLEANNIKADLSIPEETFIPLLESESDKSDTLEVEIPEKTLIMNAVKDENGEMVATDVIRAAKVTARFRNVAERHGKVDLKFQVSVPPEMRDSRWQLQLTPELYMLGDSSALDKIVITGAQYRKRQLKGYEQYRKFLESIVYDDGKFIDIRQLEIFIRRNIPKLWEYRNDSTFVSDEEFASVYGVTEHIAIEHYTNKFLVARNERKKSRTGKMFQKYVKAPIINEGIRLDTVLISESGDFIYNYTQTINTLPKLKKADIRIAGAIMEDGQQILRIPQSDPLTYYISSLSSFADLSEKYMTVTISRRVEANTASYVEFSPGKYDIDINLANNSSEIQRIKNNLTDLLLNEEFDMDSITVSASCSPEGKESLNDELARKRAASISDYFKRYLSQSRDSLRKEKGMRLSYDDSWNDKTGEMLNVNDIRFTSRSNGENWNMLDALVQKDTLLGNSEKNDYAGLKGISNLDEREKSLSLKGYYKYLREKLYPKLRVVKFDFYLHRKGMVLDTVTTTVIDTAYMAGVQAILDRDYAGAITRLKPYEDFNLAVAYCAMDYNASALSLLNKMDKTDKVHYMLAVIYSRTGKYKTAAEHYEIACSMNPSYVHRGNLDPEISALIKMFGLNSDNE